MPKNITIGSDPELFIYDASKDKIISSIGLIPGVKGEAYTEGLPEGFGLQIDNILAEFNVPPLPLNDKHAFVSNMIFMKDWITNYVKNINPNLTILCAASAMVDEDQLQSDEAKLFGCSPDYNAYTLSVNPPPEGDKTNLRTTGCHIHIGYENPNVDQSLDMIKCLDIYLGVPSVIMDEDNRRRELYGKAGCFRLTDYGFEYRVLSGYFIKDAETIGWLHDQVRLALHCYQYHGTGWIPQSTVQETINTGNKKMAEELITKFNLNGAKDKPISINEYIQKRMQMKAMIDDIKFEEVVNEI